MLFFAHSGVRYAVLLAGFIALVYFAYAAATGKGSEKVSRILGATFTGFLDLQILLGIGMVVLGLFYSALIGHLFMMIAAAVVAHASMAMAKSAEPALTSEGSVAELPGRMAKAEPVAALTVMLPKPRPVEARGARLDTRHPQI